MWMNFVITSLVAGVLGGIAMEAVLWGIGHAGWAHTDMIATLGNLLTKTRDRAWSLGLTVHIVAAIAFAMIYASLMRVLGYNIMPYSLMFGLGAGFVHGLVVSLALGWVVATNHPLEEFQEAGFAVSFSHIVGHVAYGGVVGLVVGIAAL